MRTLAVALAIAGCAVPPRPAAPRAARRAATATAPAATATAPAATATAPAAMTWLTTVGDIAMRLHEDGAAPGFADTWYAMYIALGGGDPGVLYYAGELAYARGDFCAAAPRYAEAAPELGSNRDEAAYAHLLSTLSCEHLLDETPPDPDDRAAIAPSWQRVLEATAFYLVVARTPMPEVRYLHARILYGLARFADAAPELRALADDADAGHDIANAAVALLLDADARIGDKTQLARDARRSCVLGGPCPQL